MITLMSVLGGQIYQKVTKPIMFNFDPELVHESMTGAGEFLGEIPLVKSCLSSCLAYQHPSLEQSLHGIVFKNPLGLAAGFDYDARLTQILESIGFGFQSAGTITYGFYPGNPRPMLGRLPRSQSLMVNKGFKSQGAAAVIKKLSSKDFPIPLGISIGSTNRRYKSIGEQIQEYVKAFELFEKTDIATYYEVNISCPNLKVNPFDDPKSLKKLLTEIDQMKLKKPAFMKMPIDKSPKEIKKMLDEVVKHRVQGVIFGNLTKDRSNPDLVQEEVVQFAKGNFSGKPTQKRSDALIAFAYRNYGKKLTVIGCGGVFNGDDAYRKIQLGANLVQMITGMIYMGPTVIGQINQTLQDRLQQDGFTKIGEAVGTLTV